MIRIGHENYIKTGIEYVDGMYNLSTVVTHHASDWSVITLDKPIDAIYNRNTLHETGGLERGVRSLC
jgi:hypothetical protein